MPLINVMEQIVSRKVESIWNSDAVRCKCEKCKIDVISLTLNQIKPRYISSPEGRIFVTMEVQNGPLDGEITAIINDSIHKVNDNPRH